MAWQNYPDPIEILRQPGLLFWNPIALDTEANFGTKLGYQEKPIEVNIDYRFGTLYGEEDGNEPKHKIFLGVGEIFISTLLKNYNAAALAVLFPGLVASSQVKIPNSFNAGSDLLTSNYGRLLFVPEDSTNNKVVLFQKAAPNVTGAFRLSRVLDTDFPVRFDAYRKTDDADGRIYIGPLANAVLR